jgi:hypothetical protein
MEDKVKDGRQSLTEAIAKAIYRHPNRDVLDAHNIAGDALATFREWLADEGLVVVPIHSTLQMDEAGSKEAQMAHAEGISVDAEVIWDFMIAAAPDVLKAQDPAP